MAARDSAAVSLRGWAAEAEAAAGIAKALAPTPFIPDQLKVWANPEEEDQSKRLLDLEATVATVAAVLLAGQELEFSPMASLRAFTIIRGTVAMYAIACRAILQRHGHDIVVKESTSQRAIVGARRAGTDDWQWSTWDLDRAKAAGLYPGTQYSNWRRQTKAMLVARATAEAARWVASDAMLGLPLIAEEAEDLDGEVMLALPRGHGDDDGTDPAMAPTARPTARRRRPPAPAAPASVPEPRPAAEPAPDGPKINSGQRSALYAKLRDIGIGARENREEALTLISGWAGRKVASTSDLTAAEAATVLDRLDQLRGIGARKNGPPGPAEGSGPPADEEPPPDDAEEESPGDDDG
jgi:hypothetical protein